jgi:predicted aldo/keto reductase-like oxidoreductase
MSPSVELPDMKRTAGVRYAWKDPSRSKEKEEGGELSMGRRSFLQQAGAVALGLGPFGLTRRDFAEAISSEPPSIKRYVKLGKTGLVIPDICAGGCKTANLVRHCYDRGITYFDTAQMFGGERFVAAGLKGKRDKVVITTKYKAEADNDRHKIMRHLELSLRNLKTDYIDIFLNHAVNDIERVKNPEWPEFVELAKRQGKIRFSGMSGHGGNLQECLEYVLDHDMVDVILASHNFGTDPAFYERFTKHFDLIANQKGLHRLLKKAHDKGVGVLVMKTLMGAKVNDLTKYRKDGASFHRAAFRWVFSDPNVDALVVSMKSRETADEYIRCSGDRGLEKADVEILRQYVENNTTDYCRNGCDVCESSCPYGVPVADVLRHRMYAEAYEDLDMARQGYARLGAGAGPCLSCAQPPCAEACPYGLDIASLTRATARRLSKG